jgi:hypothetical protein
MKKAALGLVFLLLSSVIFADDAKVLPMMVGRFYAVPIYSFSSGGFDKDGKLESFSLGSAKLFNMGLALEYGVIDWISAALQWTPGWTPKSEIEAITNVKYSRINGVADIFAGAKIQLLGEKAPVKSGIMRLALAPGVIIPLPGPNFRNELNKVGLGTAPVLGSMDHHVFAAGSRVYFDFVFNEYFFVNLYNETIYYPIKQDLNKDGPIFHRAKTEMASSMNNQQIMNITGDVNYGFRFIFEFEPVVSIPITEGIGFSAGLPVNYRLIPGYKYDFRFPAGIASQSQIEDTLISSLGTDQQHGLSVGPNVSFSFTKLLPIPLEIKSRYDIPAWGRNSLAMHNASLQVKAYFALPSRPR